MSDLIVSVPDHCLSFYVTKYVTNIIAEPKYKYGQQEQVIVRNHNRSTALERSVLKYWGALDCYYKTNLHITSKEKQDNGILVMSSVDCHM